MTETGTGPADRAHVDTAEDDVPEASDPILSVRTTQRDGVQVVWMSGHLDLSGRDEVFEACTRSGVHHVLADLSGLVFPDCAGYGALLAAARVLERRGGSLALANATGAPRRLLEMIDALDGCAVHPERRVAPDGHLRGPR